MLQHPEFSLHSPLSIDRQQLQNLIASKFRASYGADITEFFPLLLARQDADQVSSVAGLRTGDQRPLFLEQYLDGDIEEHLSIETGQLVDRNRIIEIGNLAASGRAGSQLLFVLLTGVLHAAGYQWVVFTATNHIRSLLNRLCFEPRTLCIADPSRLVDPNQNWGSYYDSMPEVQAGNITTAYTTLSKNPRAAALLEQHSATVDRLASELLIQKSWQKTCHV